MTEEQFLTPKELAERWKLDPKTLGVMRKKGNGPNYTDIGRIRYKMCDILEFENQRKVTPENSK